MPGIGRDVIGWDIIPSIGRDRVGYNARHRT